MAQAITRGNELQLDGFAAIVRSIKAAIERRRVFNQTVAELNLLTARELSDLGISRGSIRSVAREAAYGN